jgi:hypothetical protein
MSTDERDQPPGGPPRDQDAPTHHAPPNPSDASEAAATPSESPGERAQYTAEEQREIRDAIAAGEAPRCPRDGSTLTRRAIGGGSFGLGYARRREWLICPTCRRSALFDLRRGTRN